MNILHFLKLKRLFDEGKKAVNIQNVQKNVLFYMTSESLEAMEQQALLYFKLSLDSMDEEYRYYEYSFFTSLN